MNFPPGWSASYRVYLIRLVNRSRGSTIIPHSQSFELLMGKFSFSFFPFLSASIVVAHNQRYGALGHSPSLSHRWLLLIINAENNGFTRGHRRRCDARGHVLSKQECTLLRAAVWVRCLYARSRAHRSTKENRLAARSHGEGKKKKK